MRNLFEEMVAKGLIEIARRDDLPVDLMSSVIYRVELVAFYGRLVERLEPEDFQDRRN